MRAIVRAFHNPQSQSAKRAIDADASRDLDRDEESNQPPLLQSGGHGGLAETPTRCRVCAANDGAVRRASLNSCEVTSTRADKKSQIFGGGMIILFALFE